MDTLIVLAFVVGFAVGLFSKESVDFLLKRKENNYEHQEKWFIVKEAMMLPEPIGEVKIGTIGTVCFNKKKKYYYISFIKNGCLHGIQISKINFEIHCDKTE
jgi:hypothetical protein